MRAQCGFAGLAVRAHVNMPLFYTYQVLCLLWLCLLWLYLLCPQLFYVPGWG